MISEEFFRAQLSDGDILPVRNAHFVNIACSRMMWRSLYNASQTNVVGLLKHYFHYILDLHMAINDQQFIVMPSRQDI